MKHKQTDPARILLAIDGSRSARCAARVAAQLAVIRQWSLHALYVVDLAQVLETYSVVTDELSELQIEEMPTQRRMILFEEQGTLALAEIKSVCQAMNVPITTEMIAGDTTKIILKKASDFRLLALGQRGNRHAADSDHLGSNFRKIAHHSPVPLLIGEKGDTPKKLSKLLFAYDGEKFSQLALDWVQHMQKLFTKTLVISVEEDPGAENTWLDEKRKEIAASQLASPEFIEGKGNPGEVISKTAASRQVDLIVMGSYQHSRFLEWVKDSTLSTVLREVQTPILAAR